MSPSCGWYKWFYVQVAELSEPTSPELKGIIHSVVHGLLATLSPKMHSKAPMSENSPAGTVNVGSEDCAELVENTSLQFQPHISLTRDYLARLLFWLVQLLLSPLGCLGLKIGPSMYWACFESWSFHLCISLHIFGMSSLNANSTTGFWKISYSFWLPAFVHMYCQFIRQPVQIQSTILNCLFIILMYLLFFPP